MSADPYLLLGVPPDADDEAIKLAWRRVAKECHPDRAGAELIARFKACKVAYELLTHALRRRFFDTFGQDPYELGLRTDDQLRAALRARRGRGLPRRARVPRATCPACNGTGWRSNDRACSLCDPGMRPETAAGGPAWDPTRFKVTETGGSVPRRMKIGRPTKKKKR